MISIGKYITDNFAAFGLNSVDDLKLIEIPKSELYNGCKLIIMQAMRTLPDNTRGLPFIELLNAERFITILELECKTRASDPEKDFYWNTVRKFRDNVYNVLASQDLQGIKIPRFDWTDPDNPVEAGEIWFEVDPFGNTPLEDSIEDPRDQANKSIMLRYNVHWWRPTAITETFVNDAWVEAIGIWTEDQLGADWIVYRNAWPLNYQKPSVMWRLADASVIERTRAMYEVSKKLIGHVIGTTPNEQINTIISLMQSLLGAIKVPLDLINKRYLRVVGCQSDLKVDALRNGQLTLSLSRLTNRPTQDIPVMQKVYSSGAIK